ncbi:transcriptional coactivator yorkie isoform X2 [Copidosoma floridanum]|uniref:transcriptional coactivator yorkie isoform X2 n=1 Tax=Copidosoma floridanum TaxID=29053 RepID=UPI0006C967B4|nr:transcriptional coactivator yorkie isoform X2 [Copidosoma floridanum]
MALNQDVGDTGSANKRNLEVRIDQNSESDLQALFDSVLKPDKNRPLQVPLRMRNLPDSFFNPPSTGSKSPSISHSRENSADSAFGAGVLGGVNPAAVASGIVSNGSGSNGTTSPGATGQIQSAGLTIAHPRAHSSPASLQQTYASAQQQSQHAPQPHSARHVHHQKQRSYDVISTVDDLGPLPHGWEQARTPEGQIYYLNHITKTTTWEDPRKTAAAASVAAVAAAAVESSKANNSAAAVAAAAAAAANSALRPLPEGWEQARTPEGEIYFINHPARTTSWFDPRIPAHLQRAPLSGAMLPQSWQLQQQQQTATPGIQNNQTLQACQQKLRLQSLQMERERLKQRQQEIMRQVSSQELVMRQSTTDAAMDPFLSGINEQHARQESADSGLGLGTAYPLNGPHTPEDFLANIDDNMDGTTGAPMDTPDLSIDTTDDLVTSLQLGEDFSSDILEDVQSLINPNPTKPENILTWL